MASDSASADFIIWGIDQTAYGPVELPTLVAWVKDERVLPDTWVFATADGTWQRASQLPELQIFFRPKTTRSAASLAANVLGEIDPHKLRRVKILGAMTDEQLERFAKFIEMEQVSQFAVVVKQGDFADTMFLVLEGELRVRIMVGGKETTLATLGIGEFFGDVALFDHGPRSADVVANADSTLIKISAAAFDELGKKAPDLATPFLCAVGKTLSARIRADNKRYADSIKMARGAA
jgi:CRP/FNR family cyclic AMP-dependent transcriptional regulator